MSKNKKRKFKNFDVAKYRVEMASSYLCRYLSPYMVDQVANELTELKNDNIKKDDDKFVAHAVKNFIKISELDSLSEIEYQQDYPRFYDSAGFNSQKSKLDIIWNTYYNFMIAITADDWRVELRQDNVRYNGYTTSTEAVIKEITNNKDIMEYISLVQNEIKQYALNLMELGEDNG